MRYHHSYRIHIQFLGFRFHGWQKQIDVKTVHESVDKTFRFVFGHSNYKSLGTGRTDSKVSSINYPLQLFVCESLDEEKFLNAFNQNAPADIRAISIKRIDKAEFNIIQESKIKEYHYYFSNQGKNHPYAAPYMTGYQDLNIGLMKMAAKLFEGTHFFGNYCTKPSNESVLTRVIHTCVIEKNTILTANFFPDESYVLIVKGKGFLRYQIRLMMGALIEVGLGNKSLKQIKESLIETSIIQPQSKIAPASGLHLFDVDFLK